MNLNFISAVDLVIQRQTSALAFIIIWLIVISVVIKAKKINSNNKTIIPEYEPPQDISPVFARYLMVSGRMGGTAGEISVTGMQTLTFIDLYEDGLLEECVMIDERSLKFKIRDNYKEIKCTKDEVDFLDFLSQKVGMSGTVTERISKNSVGGDGFDEVNRFWTTFWSRNLYLQAVEAGYLKKSSWKTVPLQWFSVSLVFGVFFSFFLIFIPYIGYIIAGILMIPIIIIFAISYLIVISITSFTPAVTLIFGSISYNAIFVPFFLSWFVWILMLGKNVSKIVLVLSTGGAELVRKLKGYRMYLKSVDLSRLSFDFNRSNDFLRNKTSFAWLGIFSLLKDSHWDQWYSLNKDKSNLK
jgi:hypothetical protein